MSDAGVRIPDMPDLGVINASSYFVGERAGSGLFSAAAVQAFVQALCLPISGGTVSGPISVPGNPTAPLQLAPKQYVDQAIVSTAANYLPLAGGSVTGNLGIGGQLTVQGAVDLRSGLQFGTLGPCTLYETPTSANLQFSSDGWRIQFTRATGVLQYVNADNEAKTSLDGAGNLGCTTVTTSGPIVAGTTLFWGPPAYGSVLTSDSGSASVWFSHDGVGAGWRWQFIRATGALSYVRSDNTGMMTIDGNGSVTAFGNISAGFNVNWGAQGSSLKSDASVGAIVWNSSNYRLEYNRSNATLGYITAAGTVHQIEADGDLIIAGVGYQPGGGSWSVPSDARMKDVLGPYTRGLDDIDALNPVKYRYKDGALPIPDDQDRVGLIAQDVETVWPELVSQRVGMIGGVQVQDMRVLNTSDVIFAVVNALKALKPVLDGLQGSEAAHDTSIANLDTEIDAIKARLDALEASTP